MALLDDDLDFALAVHRSGDEWRVDDLTHDHLVDLDTLVAALRRVAGPGAAPKSGPGSDSGSDSGPGAAQDSGPGAVALVAIDEDFFLVVRVVGSTTLVLLSDVTAAREWDLADSALAFLGLPEADDDDEPVPAGDLDLLTDLGVCEVELAMLLEDVDSYPDELLSELADRLGFGRLFDDAVGLTPV